MTPHFQCSPAAGARRRLPKYFAWPLFAVVQMLATAAQADQLILDDLIVDGSHCVGSGCIDGEDFGFDTIRLKAGDPLIKFEDTSTSAAFPTNDWSMGVGNTGVGGKPQFRVRDLSGTPQDVILLEAGAGSGVALGHGSALEAAAVSFGAPGSERRVVNVDDGIDATDAVTKGQLDSYISAADSAVDAQISSLQAELDSLAQRMADIEAIIQ